MGTIEVDFARDVRTQTRDVWSSAGALLSTEMQYFTPHRDADATATEYL